MEEVAGDCIQRVEWFVHQEQLCILGKCPSQCHPLTRPTREFMGNLRAKPAKIGWSSAEPVETRKVPAEGVSSPVSKLRSVVFPQPEAPTMHPSSPAALLRQMSCNAAALALPTPCRFDTPSSDTRVQKRLRRS